MTVKCQRPILFASLICLIFVNCSEYRYTGLLPWDQYTGSPEKEPYVLELGSGKGGLLYYGAYHTIDLENSEIAEIEEKWTAFRPTLALSEGSLWPLEKTREEAISKHGEQGLLRYLANRDLVSIECIDPPLLLQARHLRNFFSAGEIKLYLILRQARVNRMLGGNSDIDTYVRELIPVLEFYRTFRFPPRRMYDVESMIRETYPELENWRRIGDEYFFNKEKGKFLPQIHRQLTAYRDQHMIGTLIKNVRKGNKVFAVVGRRHVITQEPVLRSYIK